MTSTGGVGKPVDLQQFLERVTAHDADVNKDGTVDAQDQAAATEAFRAAAGEDQLLTGAEYQRARTSPNSRMASLAMPKTLGAVSSRGTRAAKTQATPTPGAPEKQVSREAYRSKLFTTQFQLEKTNAAVKKDLMYLSIIQQKADATTAQYVNSAFAHGGASFSPALAGQLELMVFSDPNLPAQERASLLGRIYFAAASHPKGDGAKDAAAIRDKVLDGLARNQAYVRDALRAQGVDSGRVLTLATGNLSDTRGLLSTGKNYGVGLAFYNLPRPDELDVKAGPGGVSVQLAPTPSTLEAAVVAFPEHFEGGSVTSTFTLVPAGADAKNAGKVSVSAAGVELVLSWDDSNRLAVVGENPARRDGVEIRFDPSTHQVVVAQQSREPVRIAQASQGDEIFLSIHAENARLDDGTFDTGDTFRARVGNTFQSGVHELSSADRAALAAEVDRLVAFLEEHQARDKPVTVTITGGESRVPNPEGFGPGELAAARSRAAMEEIAALLEARGFELGNIRFAVQEPVIGRTPFRAGADSAKAEKFTREQFIDVTVRVEE